MEDVQDVTPHTDAKDAYLVEVAPRVFEDHSQTLAGVTGQFGSSCSRCNATQQCRVNSDCKSAMCYPVNDGSRTASLGQMGLYKLKSSHFEFFTKFDSASLYPSKNKADTSTTNENRYRKDIHVAVHAYGTDYVANYPTKEEMQDAYCAMYSGTANDVDPMSPFGNTVTEGFGNQGTGSYCKNWLMPPTCQGSDVRCDVMEMEPTNLQCRSCSDGVRNGDETCADGGGDHCREMSTRCGDGKQCKLSSDCASGRCYHEEGRDDIKRDCLPPMEDGFGGEDGHVDEFRGWYDVQGCGQCNDYCRWVGETATDGTGFGDPTTSVRQGNAWWSCKKAGSAEMFTYFDQTPGSTSTGRRMDGAGWVDDDKNPVLEYATLSGTYYGKPWSSSFQKCAGQSAINPSDDTDGSISITSGAYHYNPFGIPLLPPNEIGFGVCVSCKNGVQDGSESGVDCGGDDCPKCKNGKRCEGDVDCLSSKCDVEQHQCRALTTDELCSNEVRDDKTRESSVDCGGECTPCADDRDCNHDGDCESNSCYNNKCVSCWNDDKDGKETDKNCGGQDFFQLVGNVCGIKSGGACNVACSRCCNDGLTVSNCNECVASNSNQCTDHKTGGWDGCPACGDGKDCNVNKDCASGLCENTKCVSCSNNKQDTHESCVDGGGSICRERCGNGESCNLHSDCSSGVCFTGTSTCVACDNQYRDGNETCSDGGGNQCSRRCEVEEGCLTGSDCATGYCNMVTTDAGGFGRCRLSKPDEFCTGGVFNEDRGETVSSSALARGLNCSCCTLVGVGTLVDVSTLWRICGGDG